MKGMTLIAVIGNMRIVMICLRVAFAPFSRTIFVPTSFFPID